ncbi:MAG: hypothetical protein R2854_15360 [Caldilineaceae bacterium]
MSDDDRLYVLDANSATVQAYADSMRQVDDAVPDDGDGIAATATYTGVGRRPLSRHSAAAPAAGPSTMPDARTA